MGGKMTERSERELFCESIGMADKRHLLAQFKVHQLRWWLEDRKADTSGIKPKLIDRILEIQEDMRSAVRGIET